MMSTTLLLLLLVSGASAQTTSNCTTAVNTLAPCLAYVTGTDATPSLICCSAIAILNNNNPDCMCQVEAQDPFYFVTGLCIFGLALVSSISLFRATNRKRRLPPGPRGLPIVGNLLQMGRRPHRAMAALAKRYGHIVFLRLGQRPTVVIDSMDLILQVTKELDHVFCSRPPSTFTKLIAYDQMDFIMAPYGPHWRQMRRLCVNEILAPKRMVQATGDRNKENLGVIKGVVAEAARTGKMIDLREQLTDLSLNVMCRMLVGEFSSRMHGLKQIVHEALRIMGYMPIQDYLPFLGYWFDPTGAIREMRKVRALQDHVLDAIIQEHRDLAAGKLPGGKPDDIISTMLDTPGVDGEPELDQSAIKACISDMLAATDTSTTTNEWAMTEILRHPHIQHKLHTELDSIVGLHRIVEESDLAHFPYLTSIFKETLRLHPANCFTLPRLSMADAELAGYHIPQGTTILINLFSMGRDASVWKRPLDFDPERWMSSTESTRVADDRLYVFGNGRRACPGYALGTTLVMLSLARLFHGFEWAFPEGVDGEKLDTEEAPGFSNSPRCKLMAVAKPRLATHLYGPDGSLERQDTKRH